ncbi:hypothetical protein MLD38_026115 [Melastoma candidum]|uniref:Uncharacterized protein n=1 Tax=Melastoma candidum TaxID=119954 RepID=A0ACB9NYH5_9MYRT|nr:hypothetical protein MLD38_026115 [Melastoma candidum]
MASAVVILSKETFHQKIEKTQNPSGADGADITETAITLEVDIQEAESRELSTSDLTKEAEHDEIVSSATGDGSQFQIGKFGAKIKEFRQKFTKRYRQIYGTREVANFGPSMYALRVYDCIMAIVRSFYDIRCEFSMGKISEVEYAGLSGRIDLPKATGLRLRSPTAAKVIPKMSLGAREREADRRKNTGVLQAKGQKTLTIGVPLLREAGQ